jgi:hypothetical protein
MHKSERLDGGHDIANHNARAQSAALGGGTPAWHAMTGRLARATKARSFDRRTLSARYCGVP